MPLIENYSYSRDAVAEIREGLYGQNWPAVYIIYDDTEAYVGETLDLVRRTSQHLEEEKFSAFTDICLISDLSFNKSVILDLESFLIKYMSADGGKKLLNGNAGVSDHNYFYKTAYENEFRNIWNELIKKGIVSRSISNIENSELFKYSPYKVLSKDQEQTAYDILNDLYKANNASQKSLIEVRGGAGTGKTILAVYIIKLLHDISEHKDIWNYADDEVSYYLRRLTDKIQGISRIGFVVPMRTLRNAMKKIFKSIDGLSEKMVLAPEEVVGQQRFDLLVVDEAHRLYRRYNLPGPHLFTKFDKINRELIGEDNVKRDVTDPTELDWIIESSRLQILFYDSLQTIRATDIDPERFDHICAPHLIRYYTLLSQMRCKGGNGYYEYVKLVLESTDLSTKEYKCFDGYKTLVVDNINDLFVNIEKNDTKYGLCRVVCGPGWKKDEAIVIQGNTYHWASEEETASNVSSILSIHKSQGFDLNYAGVIFGKEIYYDDVEKRIKVRKKDLMDKFVKSNGDVAMRQYVINIYLTLMTRGIHGTYVFAVDESLRDYLKEFLN